MSAARWTCLAVVLAAGCNEPPQRATGNDNWAPEGPWIEVWKDDFTGPAGSAPDAASWRVVATGSPPNGELEYYTDRRANTFLDGNGNLVIRAIHEDFMGKSYTSGRLDSRGLREFTYGRFEARLKTPAGRGYWPAFWLLGSVGSWPACGEIDGMELRGSDPTVAQGSLHGPQFFGGGALTQRTMPVSPTFAEEFHVFAIEWTKDGIRWLVDDAPFFVKTHATIDALNYTWVFDAPFHIILNLAVGGTWDGPPTADTPFPGDLVLDYIRVSRQATP
jgi:beta-glucanase (GH16 family)